MDVKCFWRLTSNKPGEGIALIIGHCSLRTFTSLLRIRLCTLHSMCKVCDAVRLSVAITKMKKISFCNGMPPIPGVKTVFTPGIDGIPLQNEIFVNLVIATEI